MTKKARNKNTAFRPGEVCSTVQANPEMGMRQGKLDYTNIIEDNLCSNNLRMVQPKYHYKPRPDGNAVLAKKLNCLLPTPATSLQWRSMT